LVSSFISIGILKLILLLFLNGYLGGGVVSVAEFLKTYLDYWGWFTTRICWI